MSGLFGILDSKRSTEIAPLISEMGEKMSHREWYVVDTISDQSSGIGLGRICIGIFNKEKQPLVNDDNKLVVFLSGELYHTNYTHDDLENHPIQSRDYCDIKRVLDLYLREDIQFIPELEGVFLIIIWDKKKHEIIIVNDRFGLIPMYYTHFNGMFVFAPEVKGILCHPDFNKKLDMVAFAEYMRFQFLLGEKTFFEGISLLPNASILRYNIQTDNLKIVSYWDFSKIPATPETDDFNEAVEIASGLLKSAVNRLTTREHRCGVFLSGGLDSRVILGMIGREKSPVPTITFGQAGTRDVVYAQRVAKKVGSQHHYFEIKNGNWVLDYVDLHLELTEGFHSWIHAHGISFLHKIRQIMDVNLTGLHGDPIDWDDPAVYYAPDKLAFINHLYNLLSQKTTWPSINEIEEKELYSYRISDQMSGLAFDSLRTEVTKNDSLPFQRIIDKFSFENVRRLFRYYTVFNNSHIEQRYPFYDYRYFDFIHSLSPEMLFKRKLRRAVILKEMPGLAKIPYDKDELPITRTELSRLMTVAVKRSKSYTNKYIAPIYTEYSQLSTDYENWLRNELYEWGEEILLGDQINQRNIFNPECLRSLWYRHQSGLEPDFIGKIAPIMTYEMMLRRFYD